MGKSAQVISIFGDKMRKVVERADGFTNLITGLGTARDKTTSNRFSRAAIIDVEVLDALYSQEDMAARICDVVPEEELRQGFDVVIAPDAEDTSGEAIDDAASVSDAVKDETDRLEVQAKIIEARVWSRVFGGGALLLGVDDGATVENGLLVQPLNEAGIKSFDHVNVLDRRFIHPLTYYSDPTEAKVGQPKTYLITPQAADSPEAAASSMGTIEIHESRLVVFGGTRTTIVTRQRNSGWGTPVLERVNTILTQFGVSWDALAHMLQDASQGVFKMRGFIDALAAEETGLVMKRLDIMDMGRSIVRALVLDEEGESFERQNFNWSGIKEPYQLFMLRLSSAAKMPATILMSQSPSGMDATGESDVRWFYDTIQTSRENEVKPALMYITRLIMAASSGPTSGQVPESWNITFPSLWQMTPLEQAQIEKLAAEKDAIEIASGVVTPEEVAVSRHTADGWRSDTAINLEERRAVLEADLDADILDTPTLGDDGEPVDPDASPEPQKAALAGGQSTFLLTVAKDVQSGALDRESAIALVMAANPDIEAEQAGAIVGEPDEEKIAQREALTEALSGAGDPSGGDDPDGPPAPPDEKEEPPTDGAR